MKNLLLILLTVIALGQAHAQFRDKEIFKPTVREGIVNDDPALILGILEPAKFSMSHSYSLSYSSFGNNGMALGVYTNSLLYRFSEKLNLEVDASFVHSPYNSFGRDFQNQINGIYLNRAQLNYRPWENFNVMFSYRRAPFGDYYDSPFHYRGNFFSPTSVFDFER